MLIVSIALYSDVNHNFQWLFVNFYLFIKIVTIKLIIIVWLWMKFIWCGLSALVTNIQVAPTLFPSLEECFFCSSWVYLKLLHVAWVCIAFHVTSLLRSYKNVEIIWLNIPTWSTCSNRHVELSIINTSSMPQMCAYLQYSNNILFHV